MERSLGSACRSWRTICGQHSVDQCASCMPRITYSLTNTSFFFASSSISQTSVKMSQNRLIDFLSVVFILAMFCPSGECIHCWDCNSAYDPRCGDPFDNHSIALVDCSQMSYPHLAVKEASLCRKTTQKVNGVLRVVRSCGWLNSSMEDGGSSCFQRSGSQDVYLTHCTCFTDGCNGGHAFKPNTHFFFALPIFLLLLFRAV